MSADLEIICGNDAVATVQLYAADGSTPLDLTGVTEIVYVAKKQASPDYPALITKTYTDSGGITITGDPEDGLIAIAFEDTDTLPEEGERLVGYFDHELQVVDANGNKSTVFPTPSVSGHLTILPTAVA